MSFLDRIGSYVSHLFDSSPAQAPQPVPVTVVRRPDSYGVANPSVPPTQARGAERNFQAPVRQQNNSGNGIGGGLVAGGLVAVAALAVGATGGMALLLGGAAFLVGCGPSDNESTDPNLDLPDASRPVTQNEFCSGTQRLVENHNVAQSGVDAGPQTLAQYPAIRDYLNAHLPEGLTLDNAMVATNPTDPQYVYVLAHTPDGAPLAEVGTSTMIFRFQRTMSGYAPFDYPRSLPLNGMHNVLYSSYIGPVSMAYLNPEDFRHVQVGNQQVNISNILTSNPVIAVVFHDAQDSQEPTRISFIDYQNGTYVQAPGTRDSANVCATYGEILNSQVQSQGDAGRTDVMDASADANHDASTTDRLDANRDASSDRSDAGADVRNASDAASDANRDSSADRPDAGTDVHDASDASRDAGVDANRDAGDASIDARG